MVETLIETIAIEAITILAGRAVIGKTMMMVELRKRIAIIEISMDQKIEIGKLNHSNHNKHISILSFITFSAKIQMISF